MKIVSIENVDSGVSRRRRVTIVVPPDASPETCEAALLTGIAQSRTLGIVDAIWNGPIDCVFAFVWRDRSHVDRTPAVARAQFVRSAATLRPLVTFRSHHTVAVKGGTVYVPEGQP